MSEQTTQLEETLSSIKRLVSYDTSSIARRDELGTALSFESAIKPTEKVISIFKRIPVQNLDEVPETELKLIENQADAFFNILDKIQEFDSDTLNSSTRDNIISQIESQHQPIFSKLHPIISYLTIRTTNFADLETNARAAVESAKKEAQKAKEDVTKLASDAEVAMDTIRATAREQGVSQQAIYFKDEADDHEEAASGWKKITFGAAFVLALFALSSFFIHKIPTLVPNSTYEAVQIAISKFLLFGVLGYVLVLCARNFLSHKHNAVVNRHKQNSLVTFEALAKASQFNATQDIILERASHAIFAIPESGFTKNPTQSPSIGNSVMPLAPRVVSED